ncbi:MAG: hypothetical protein V1735_02195 [Nanoarchaeota archaeon]
MKAFFLVLMAAFLAGCAQQPAATMPGDGRLLVAIGVQGNGPPMAVTIDEMTVKGAEGQVSIINGSFRAGLTSNLSLVANISLPEGIYNQVSFTFRSVAVGEDDALLPSSSFPVLFPFAVRPGETTAIILRIKGNESLRYLNDGKPVMAPSMDIIIWDDAAFTPEVVPPEDQSSLLPFGMDIDGNVGPGMSIPDIPLVLREDGKLFFDI